LKALNEAVAALAKTGKEAAKRILDALQMLEADASLLDALHRRVLIEKGLELVCKSAA
jgi:hypothetical protein